MFLYGRPANGTVLNFTLFRTMKLPIRSIILLLLFASVWATKRETSCTRYDLGDELDIQCTYKDIEYDYDNNEILFIKQFKTLKKVTIECQSDHIDFMEMLPKINVEKMNQVQIEYCPLPPQGFLSLLQGLNISQTRLLRIGGLSSVDDGNVRINKRLFEGLRFLGHLELSNNDEAILLEDNFIEELPELKKLDVYHNKFVNLDVLNLSVVPDLERLQIGRNNIKAIPKQLFQNLPTLKQLNLFTDNLENLNGDTFAGTENVEMLQLSGNQIQTIDADTFGNMVNLVNVSFLNNNLTWFGRAVFKNSKKLYQVILSYNTGMRMEDYALADLPNLKVVMLDMCQMGFLPPNLFAGSVNLEEINLHRNSLEELPDGLFHRLTKLVILNLGDNKLMTVTERTFELLVSLKHLDLKNNQLTKISTYLFKNLVKLETLDLQHNKIVAISERAFYNLTALEALNLSHNQFKFVDMRFGIGPFVQCIKLRDLDLSFSGLEEWNGFYMSPSIYLEKVNVSNNNIKEIKLLDLMENVFADEISMDFSSNQISIVDVFLPSAFNETNMAIKLNIANNPIRCDCYNYGLISHLQGDLDLFNIFKFHSFRDLICNNPVGFSDFKLAKIPRSLISCPLHQLVTDGGQCDDSCDCFWKPHDSSFVMDCSHRNLREIPKFKAPSVVRLNGSRIGGTIEAVEVYMEDNDLKTTPGETDGYDNVTKLIMSHNIIDTIHWIPSNLTVLHLDNNHLTYLPQSIIELLNSSSINNVTLNSNPWTCDCSTQTFRDYLFNSKDQVDSRDIRCKDTNQTVIQTPNLCKSKKVAILSASIILVLLMFIFASSIALYYMYQEEIKVWLYSKNLCLWFVTEEELDKDKVYDAFISFSHKDDEFVLKTLLPKLESGPDGFKVCVHYRDFIPGETISNQVAKSVSDSRRTLVVLSNSFIESCWAKMEFRMAHTQAIREGRVRVIVVVYGDIDESKLDDELKAYLRTNTYIKWGDPWFWQKLTYALPHRKHHDKFSLKRSNMLSVDPKFESCTQSTPPILENKLLSSYPDCIKETIVQIDTSG